MRRNYGDAAAHLSTTRKDHTHIHTNISKRHTNRATHHKNKTCTRATALCVAPVSRLARFLQSGIMTYQPKGSIDV